MHRFYVAYNAEFIFVRIDVFSGTCRDSFYERKLKSSSLVYFWYFFPGITRGPVDKSIANARRFRLQNIRPWKKIGQFNHLHYVFVNYIVEYLDAIVLFPVRFYKIRNISGGKSKFVLLRKEENKEICKALDSIVTGVHVDVSNINARSVGRSNGRDDVAYKRNPRTAGGCVFYFVPFIRYVGKFCTRS